MFYTSYKSYIITNWISGTINHSFSRKFTFKRFHFIETKPIVHILLTQSIATLKNISTVEVSCIFISSPTSIWRIPVFWIFVAYFEEVLEVHLHATATKHGLRNLFCSSMQPYLNRYLCLAQNASLKIPPQRTQMHTFIHRYDFQVIQPLKFICCLKEQGFKTTWLRRNMIFRSVNLQKRESDGIINFLHPIAQ